MAGITFALGSSDMNHSLGISGGFSTAAAVRGSDVETVHMHNHLAKENPHAHRGPRVGDARMRHPPPRRPSPTGTEATAGPQASPVDSRLWIRSDMGGTVSKMQFGAKRGSRLAPFHPRFSKIKAGGATLPDMGETLSLFAGEAVAK